MNSRHPLVRTDRVWPNPRRRCEGSQSRDECDVLPRCLIFVKRKRIADPTGRVLDGHSLGIVDKQLRYLHLNLTKIRIGEIMERYNMCLVSTMDKQLMYLRINLSI